MISCQAKHDGYIDARIASSSKESHSFGCSKCTWSSTICKCREYLMGIWTKWSATQNVRIPWIHGMFWNIFKRFSILPIETDERQITPQIFHKNYTFIGPLYRAVRMPEMTSISLAPLEITPHRLFFVQEFHHCDGLKEVGIGDPRLNQFLAKAHDFFLQYVYSMHVHYEYIHWSLYYLSTVTQL